MAALLRRAIFKMQLLQTKYILNYCKVPYLVINHLHRSKLDANQEIGEAAQGNAVAETTWTHFHTFINDAQLEVESQYGTSTFDTSTGSSKTSIPGCQMGLGF
jgi:hypothetical protein